jgi:hypothetical protein
VLGQRYHVIVEANPVEPTADGNYWIRTVPAEGCGAFAQPYDVTNSTTGIVRYNESSAAPPTSNHLAFPLKCSDEPYGKLEPILKWDVSKTNIFNYIGLLLYKSK